MKNTGRCRELLIPGCTVFLASAQNPARKTGYDLIAVEKLCDQVPVLINMDSQVVNDAAEEWLREKFPGAVIKREVRRGNSRFDFYLEHGERRAFLEVKGVTLEREGTAFFPDAPTERGIKHLRELMECLKDGYDACVLFVIQMKGVKCFHPNDAMHPEFGAMLRKVQQAGVKVLAVDARVAPDEIVIDEQIPVEL